MNEYNIKVDFTKGKIFTNLKKLVQNDYNTTKLNFTFDKEGRVLFKLLYPDGTQYVDEIQNNELIFGPGILNQEGDYEYEISLYTVDGRLTDYATKSFEVRSELVNTDELVAPDDRVPVLDGLINEVTAIKTSAENGEFDGENGQDGITPTIGENGNWFLGDFDTGLPSKGPQGEPGSVKLIPVSELPNENIDDTAIYVKPSEKPDDKNKYEEFIYINGKWEPFGSGGITVNLDDYFTKEEITAITGELENLNTEDKSNLVNAINEVMNGGSVINDLTENTDLTELPSGFYRNVTSSSIKVTIGTTGSYKTRYLSGGAVYFWCNMATEYIATNSYNSYLLTISSGNVGRYLIIVSVTLSKNAEGKYYNYNANLEECIDLSKVLTKDNTTKYKVSSNYNPAHKLYVDTATGDLTTLATEDKSNLVNAINEVAGSSGSPVYYLCCELEKSLIGKQNGVDIGTDGAARLTEIVNDAYKKGYKSFALLLKTNTNSDSQALLNFGKTANNLEKKPTQIALTTINTQNLFDDNCFYLYSLMIVINITWNGEIATVTNALISSGSSRVMTTNNTKSYTPTSDYNPANKKYVDDNISSLENVLTGILEAIQTGGTTASTVAEIEQLIVSYFENTTIEEVEG